MRCDTGNSVPSTYSSQDAAPDEESEPPSEEPPAPSGALASDEALAALREKLTGNTE